MSARLASVDAGRKFTRQNLANILWAYASLEVRLSHAMRVAHDLHTAIQHCANSLIVKDGSDVAAILVQVWRALNS